MTDSNVERWIEQLRKCQPIKESEVKVLCQQALDVLVEESNVQRVNAPVTICAHTHLLPLAGAFRAAVPSPVCASVQRV